MWIDTAQMVLYTATILCVWPLVVIERALKRGEHLEDPMNPNPQELLYLR